MIRNAIAATALLFALPAHAQSTTQDELDARYDRALAAGYKALFLCGAIANAERNGATRTPESVMEWELAGIQAPLDGIVGELPYRIVRGESGLVDWVEVDWVDDMPPRYAVNFNFVGCSLRPISDAPPAEWEHPNMDSLGAATEVVSSPDERLAGFVPANGTHWGDGTRSTAMLVMRDGVVIQESYQSGFGPSTPQRTWSVAKSLAATLVGHASLLSGQDATAVTALEAPGRDLRRTITVDHLLRMASGRYSDTPGNRTDGLYFGGRSLDEDMYAWPSLYAPGTVFRYANNDTLLAVRAIRPLMKDVAGADFLFVRHFLAEVGMTNTMPETDWQKNYLLSSQVWSTARDLARLGQLYLDDGVLPSGERVLPEGWVQYVSSPSGPQPDGPLGYGAGFWLFNKTDGIPPDTFAMQGNRGQFVVIVPSRNIVIVRRGEDPVGSRFDILSFTRDVLAALD